MGGPKVATRGQNDQRRKNQPGRRTKSTPLHRRRRLRTPRRRNPHLHRTRRRQRTNTPNGRRNTNIPTIHTSLTKKTPGAARPRGQTRVKSYDAGGSAITRTSSGSALGASGTASPSLRISSRFLSSEQNSTNSDGSLLNRSRTFAGIAKNDF